jgi:D-beta-D-heptose 7-phosphate kinase/D-beta-D-heptose 1-phosphate adenosyltransferase
MKKSSKKKKIVVAVSGGFDPIHIGHVRMFEEAKKLGNELVVILNNDHWLKKKRGVVFMSQNERKEIVGAFKPVDRVIFTKHQSNPKDMSVASDLLVLKPNIFVNGGDRKPGNIRPAESDICTKIGCREVFNIGRGDKIQSSSQLLDNFLKQTQKLKKNN